MYSLDTEYGLRKVPFVSMASETLNHITGQLSSEEWKQRFLTHGNKHTF